MGSLCGSTQTTTAQQSTTPTDLAGLQNIFGRVQSAAQTPFTPYTGQMTAPINQQQQTGIAGVNSAAGSAQPFFSKAADFASSGAAPIQSSDITRLMNPFTQNVIDATKANFAEDNGQAQNALKAKAAMVGAGGGSGQGVAAAELARQEQLAQASVLAQLQRDNYTQAVTAAQADRAAQQYGAGAYSTIGTAAQRAGLEGAGAQIGAGTVEQQTQQQANDAAYKLWQQQQALPYAQAQFFSQFGTPAALAQGSSTSGTQTAPGPNPLTQLLSLGTAGVTAYSDERVKENIKLVGKTFDGQNLYSYNFPGSPTTQVGLIAQEVERKHPESVGQSHGIKTVDYASATDDAAKRGHFADGGIVGLDSPFNFIASGVDFIPKGGGAPSGKLYTPTLQYPKPADDGSIAAAGKFAGTAGKIFGAGSGQMTGGWGATSTGAEGVGGIGGLYSHGGLVDAIHGIHTAIKRARGGSVGPSPFAPFAKGGAVSEDEGSSRAWARRIARGNNFADGGSPFSDRFDAVYARPDSADPVPVEAPYRLAGPAAMDAWRKDVDASRSGTVPALGPADNSAPVPSAASASGLPRQITGPEQDDAPTGALAFNSTARRPAADASGASPLDDAPWPAGPGPASEPLPLSGSPFTATGNGKAGNGDAGGSRFGGFNPLGLSDKAREAIITGALGVAASRSPFALSAIGEGGIRGMQAYSAASAAEREAADKQISHDQAAQRILREIEGQKETARHNAAQERLSARSQAEKGQMTDYQKVQSELLKRGASLKASEPIEIGTSVTGTPVKALPRFNSSTGEYDLYPIGTDGTVSDTPVKPGSSIRSKAPARPDGPAPDGTAPPASPAARNETYLKSLADEDAGYAEAVRKAANYEVNPNTYASLRAGQRQKFLNDVLRYDPTYDAATFPARAQAVKDFTAGKKGDTIRSFDVAIAHLDTLRGLSDALHNGNMQLVNKLSNDFKNQFGYPAPSNFEAAKGIVGDELVKVIVGGQNALGDREEAKAQVSAAKTPEQLNGVIDTWMKLLGGQLHGFKRQYEHGTGLHNFESRLSERTKQAIADAERSGFNPASAGGGSGNAVPPAADRQVGKLYNTPRNGPMIWTGDGWRQP